MFLASSAAACSLSHHTRTGSSNRKATLARSAASGAPVSAFLSVANAWVAASYGPVAAANFSVLVLVVAPRAGIGMSASIAFVHPSGATATPLIAVAAPV